MRYKLLVNSGSRGDEGIINEYMKNTNRGKPDCEPFEVLQLKDVTNIHLVGKQKTIHILRKGKTELRLIPVDVHRLHHWYGSLREALMESRVKTPKTERRNKKIKGILRSQTKPELDMKDSLAKMKERRISKSITGLNEFQRLDDEQTLETSSLPTSIMSESSGRRARIPIGTSIAKDIYLKHEGCMTEVAEVIVNEDLEQFSKHTGDEDDVSLEAEADVEVKLADRLCPEDFQMSPRSIRSSKILHGLNFPRKISDTAAVQSRSSGRKLSAEAQQNRKLSSEVGSRKTSLNNPEYKRFLTVGVVELTNHYAVTTQDTDGRFVDGNKSVTYPTKDKDNDSQEKIIAVKDRALANANNHDDTKDNVKDQESSGFEKDIKKVDLPAVRKEENIIGKQAIKTDEYSYKEYVNLEARNKDKINDLENKAKTVKKKDNQEYRDSFEKEKVKLDDEIDDVETQADKATRKDRHEHGDSCEKEEVKSDSAEDNKDSIDLEVKNDDEKDKQEHGDYYEMEKLKLDNTEATKIDQQERFVRFSSEDTVSEFSTQKSRKSRLRFSWKKLVRASSNLVAGSGQRLAYSFRVKRFAEKTERIDEGYEQPDNNKDASDKPDEMRADEEVDVDPANDESRTSSNYVQRTEILRGNDETSRATRRNTFSGIMLKETLRKLNLKNEGRSSLTQTSESIFNLQERFDQQAEERALFHSEIDERLKRVILESGKSKITEQSSQSDVAPQIPEKPLKFKIRQLEKLVEGSLASGKKFCLQEVLSRLDLLRRR